MTMALAIGVGCRRAWSSDAIVALVEQTCAGLDRRDARLFTIAAKGNDPALRAASDRLGLPLVLLSAGDLAARLSDVTICSTRVAAAIGVPSVAEAAALAGAGAGSRLLVPRRTDGGATCAIAVPMETP